MAASNDARSRPSRHATCCSGQSDTPARAVIYRHFGDARTGLGAWFWDARGSVGRMDTGLLVVTYCSASHGSGCARTVDVGVCRLEMSNLRSETLVDHDDGVVAGSKETPGRRSLEGDSVADAVSCGCSPCGGNGNRVGVEPGDHVVWVGEREGDGHPPVAAADHRNSPPAWRHSYLGLWATYSESRGSPGTSCTSRSTNPASVSISRASSSPQAVPSPAPSSARETVMQCRVLTA